MIKNMKRKKRNNFLTFSFFAIVIVGLLFFGRTNFLAIITNEVSLTPVADSYVSSKGSNDNNGAYAYLYAGDDVRRCSGDGCVHNYKSESYIKFKIDELVRSKILSGEYKITNAVLGIYVYDENGAINSFSLSSNEWNENTITWNNKPLAEQQLLTIKISDNRKYFEIPNIQQAVFDKLNQGSEISFAIVDGGSSDDQTKFYSKEGTNKPYLKLTYQVSQKVYRFENNQCVAYDVFDTLSNDFKKLEDCEKLIQLDIYRLENNLCSQIKINKTEIREADYNSLLECQGFVQTTLYRFQNNSCSQIIILSSQRILNDYGSVEECSSKIQISPVCEITGFFCDEVSPPTPELDFEPTSTSSSYSPGTVSSQTTASTTIDSETLNDSQSNNNLLYIIGTVIFLVIALIFWWKTRKRR